MDVINEIIQNSAIGAMPKGYKSLVLLVFSTIVSILFSMLIFLIINAQNVVINFGY